jgi:delta11-fatty-acid desaturase
MAEGRDATALFESHHQFSDLKKIEAIKQKLLVPNPKIVIQKADEYDWELTLNSAFTKELRQGANEILSRDSIKASTRRWLEMIILTALWLYTIPAFVRGNWIMLFLTPFLCWVAGVNAFHDASHFAVSDSWQINTFLSYLHPWFSSPTMWAHQHVIGHHCYPNIPSKDPDMYHAPKLIRHTKTMRHRPAYRYQHFTFIITWILGLAFMAQVNSIRLVFFGGGKFNRTTEYMKLSESRKNLHLFGRALCFCLIYAWPFFTFTFLKALVWALVPIYFFSILFMVSTQINHLVPESVDVHHPNFFIHQIITSHNVATDNYLVFLLTGGLNHQIEHHLFPSVNHCHLRALRTLVKDLCKKHNVAYNETPTLGEALVKHVKHLEILSHKEVKSD